MLLSPIMRLTVLVVWKIRVKMLCSLLNLPFALPAALMEPTRGQCLMFPHNQTLCVDKEACVWCSYDARCCCCCLEIITAISSSRKPVPLHVECLLWMELSQASIISRRFPYSGTGHALYDSTNVVVRFNDLEGKPQKGLIVCSHFTLPGGFYRENKVCSLTRKNCLALIICVVLCDAFGYGYIAERN